MNPKKNICRQAASSMAKGRVVTGELKPFMSILLIITTLFLVVFLKMEVRSQGYAVWKRVRAYGKMRDSHRLKFIEYVRLKSPFRLSEQLGDKVTYVDDGVAQVIQMSGDHVAVKQ